MDPTTLYQHYYPTIYRQVQGYIQQREQAEDLTQDTFLKALRALDRAPEQPDALRRWLGCIAKNTVIDYVRRERKVIWNELYESSSVNTSDLSETMARHLEIQAVLHALPKRTSQILLASTEGCTIREIAALMGISPNVAKMRLCRARQQFKQCYLAAQASEVSHG